MGGMDGFGFKNIFFSFLITVKQMILHFYTERFLFLRLSFRKALQCVEKGIYVDISVILN